MTLFPYQLTKQLLLDYLKLHPQGQYSHAVGGVVKAAIDKGHYPSKASPGSSVGWEYQLQMADRVEVPELIRQLLWQLLVQGLIVFGQDAENPNWPFYRVTAWGAKVMDEGRPQPYDPTGFLNEFRKTVPNADPVVFDYLQEAVQCFNHSCPKGSAVLLGAASEKLVLVLHETFEKAVSDPAKQAAFAKKSAKNWTISHKYDVLKDHLDYCVTTKNLPKELCETVDNQLPGTFNLIRQLRNAAGHPEIAETVNPDAVFLNLRVFIEYARRATELIDYFKVHPAKW